MKRKRNLVKTYASMMTKCSGISEWKKRSAGFCVTGFHMQRKVFLHVLNMTKIMWRFYYKGLSNIL